MSLRSPPVTGDNKKRARADGIRGFILQHFSSDNGEVCAAVVAFLFHAPHGQRFTANSASVSLLAFTQPFICLTFLDSFKVRVYVFAVFQVSRGYVLEFFA